MSIWLEIHCESQASDFCKSQRGDHPSMMAGDMNAQLLETYRLLSDMAKKKGWKKTERGWVCKYCLACQRSNTSTS